MIPDFNQGYLRYECVNFDCPVNPSGYYLVSTEHPDDDATPICQHCGAPLVRKDVMTTNLLLWELGFKTEE